MDLPSLISHYESNNVDLKSFDFKSLPVDEDIILGGAQEISFYDKEVANLKSYTDALPYKCESIDEMQVNLEAIVGKMAICIEAKDWLRLGHWDDVLLYWLRLRYPIKTSLRAKLAHIFYELALLPGIEDRYSRRWADLFAKLLGDSSLGLRKLTSADLQLSWKNLWRVTYKEISKKRLMEEVTSRPMLNPYLDMAARANAYYPVEEIPQMLETFLPLLTPEVTLFMVPVLTSFLPRARSDLYIPVLFKIWEAFNSSTADERFLDFAGALSEGLVAGKEGELGQYGTKWKDIGIWTRQHWDVLVGKGLDSMNIPIGAASGASRTGHHADSSADRVSRKVKKPINRLKALAKIIVYSMAVDGPVSTDVATSNNSTDKKLHTRNAGYVAGSQAMDSLGRIITSTESFYHPSNTGQWNMALTSFLHRLTTEFSKRWAEESLPSCRTPKAQRLTPAIRRAFVLTLRTPALLALFSKEPLPMVLAQTALKFMAMSEPKLIMPELLERAFGGLEVVNETHRTTAVLSMLSQITLPLLSESIWVGGQRHLLPLLEMCIPGIDLNDPNKTLGSAKFITNAVRHVKLGDISTLPSTVSSSDAMEVDAEGDILITDGAAEMVKLSLDDERSITRDNAAGFADWVTSLFRRVLTLYENLPEEGGKKNQTGGKQEEGVLKAIKEMLDVVCSHLSDDLFDLVLTLVFDYFTTNAKANAVRAITQLVGSLSRVSPGKTLAKFLPVCSRKIEEELKHGASSTRSNSTHAAAPSDTALHWNMSVLGGCLAYSGPELLKYKEEFINLLLLLLDGTKSERGYTIAGGLFRDIMTALTAIYPLSDRFVNDQEWEDPAFRSDHNLHWGKYYKADQIHISWHVPSQSEIEFALEILDRIATPTLDKVEALISSMNSWDNVDRNDFCRYLFACQSMWVGLPTLVREEILRPSPNLGIDEEIQPRALLVAMFDVQAGFALSDPNEPCYHRATKHRQRFGQLTQHAASTLRENSKSVSGDDNIDPTMVVSRAIDIYLLAYGIRQSRFSSAQTSYATARDLNLIWPGQEENSRKVLIQRAETYHCSRLYLQTRLRRRSKLDDQLLMELAYSSLSPYTKVRTNAQGLLRKATTCFSRSTILILPTILAALGKGNDPDRMKGALYVLKDKGTTTALYTLTDLNFHGRFLLSLLECDHEEKPSIQTLVKNLAKEASNAMKEATIHTDAYTLDTRSVQDIVSQLGKEFSSSFIDTALLKEAVAKTSARIKKRSDLYSETVISILRISSKSNTHWRYSQMASKFLEHLLRRDVPASDAVARFFVENSINPQPTTRSSAAAGLSKLASVVKARTFSKSSEELWRGEWSNPLKIDVAVGDVSQFLKRLEAPMQSDGILFDRIDTGFLAWTNTVKGYQRSQQSSKGLWEPASQEAVTTIYQITVSEGYLGKLAALWSQESSKTDSQTELRVENMTLMKSLAKLVEVDILTPILPVLDPLLIDVDKYKQRAGAEIVVGLLRGSKRWPEIHQQRLWEWVTPRLDTVFAAIKPETLHMWEQCFGSILDAGDPRRSKPLLDWIMALPLEFKEQPAFTTTKTLTLLALVVECLSLRFNPLADRFAQLLFDAANTDYAEVRGKVAHNLLAMTRNQWQPGYSSVGELLTACKNHPDPLHIRETRFSKPLGHLLEQLPKWKGERLPPPRTNQSEYDKVGLTLLQWIWVSAYSPQASLIFPYVVPMMPQILEMCELNDSSDLQVYSAAVSIIISGVTPPVEYVELILGNFVHAIKSSTSWRIRSHALPALVVFFYRNLLNISDAGVTQVMDALLDCLADENVEVREKASEVLAGIVRCSQRQSIIPLKNRFVAMIRNNPFPSRKDPKYAETLRSLHSAVLGICSLILSTPYSVEAWMPPLTEVLAPHATDPPPISNTIRKCASEFKKTHQDTWHKDQQTFNEDQLQSLSTMLVGTSYYA